MNIDIFIVPCNKKHILRNMLELYLHDVSEFDDEYKSLELNEAGLYDYNYLDYYWMEEGRYPYIISVDGKLAGFSFIKTVKGESLTFEVAEFFILRKYRKKGIGKELINRIFSLHKGNWTIDTHIKNTIAQNFWRNAVKSNAIGEYKETLIENGRRMKWSFKNCDCI
jgi:predicted acetyltransferase